MSAKQMTLAQLVDIVMLGCESSKRCTAIHTIISEHTALSRGKEETMLHKMHVVLCLQARLEYSNVTRVCTQAYIAYKLC